MALILNIETATTVCSVSIAKDGQLLAFKEQDGDYTHAENLTVFIEEVLKQANIPITTLDAIAVSKGPGSYTGLRIGVSAAKGLCYALDKPLIAIDTLKHLSLDLSEGEGRGDCAVFCPMIDARRMEVYCGLYNNKLQNICPVSAEIVDEHFIDKLLSVANIDKTTATVYFFGNGASKCRELIEKNANTIYVDNVIASAKSMIALSELAFENKQFEDVAYFEPFYLKDFVAGKKKNAEKA
jgi:tRNA threonylcarbamoyladenosine biosynthesis protein TsaB